MGNDEKYVCRDCGKVLDADEVEFCPWCGDPLCLDCYEDHVASCTESPDGFYDEGFYDADEFDEMDAEAYGPYEFDDEPYGGFDEEFDEDFLD